MQDFIGRLIDMLQVDDPSSAEGMQDGEQRARAMLEVAVAVLHAHVAPQEIVRLMGETLDGLAAADRDRVTLALAATPTEQFGDCLLGFLRQRDAIDPAQAGRAREEAAAMILAGAAFLQERDGAERMGTCVGNLARLVQEAGAAEAASTPLPALPGPDTVRAALAEVPLVPALKRRIVAMADHLRASTPAEGQAMALASFMAAGLFLRERQGEAYAVEALRHVESTVSQQAALDRWQPESMVGH